MISRQLHEVIDRDTLCNASGSNRAAEVTRNSDGRLWSALNGPTLGIQGPSSDRLKLDDETGINDSNHVAPLAELEIGVSCFPLPPLCSILTHFLTYETWDSVVNSLYTLYSVLRLLGVLFWPLDIHSFCNPSQSLLVFDLVSTSADSLFHVL